jgi:cell wall-associated NlpC family hydrolase
LVSTRSAAKTLRNTLIGLAGTGLLLTAPALATDTGGVGTSSTGGTTTTTNCDPAENHARLVDGKAYAPSCAPLRVKYAIRNANSIRKKPYVWGGGHAYPWSQAAPDNQRGYDCSGAVSWALHGANAISRPKTSGQLAHWGEPGARSNRWINVYANSSHVYMKIAGLRFDTSGGPGPRWHSDSRSSSGFAKRHKNNL